MFKYGKSNNLASAKANHAPFPFLQRLQPRWRFSSQKNHIRRPSRSKLFDLFFGVALIRWDFTFPTIIVAMDICTVIGAWMEPP